MTVISRSLALKWIATLMLTGLVGVALVGVFAYRTAVTEFDRLRTEQAQTTFVANVTSYYQTRGSWDGLENWLRAQDEDNRNGRGGPQLFTVADANGTFVCDAGPFHAGGQARQQDINDGVPIIVDGERVGTAVRALPPPAPDPREQEYLSRTNQALLIGAVGAGAAALLIGILLSRHFLRPLAELTTAIKAMRAGDLAQQVTVRTNDELGELAKTFNQMSAEIHRANQLRKQMTADIAHDLRTPLMVISGYLEALTDGTLQPTQARFEAMSQEASLLTRLIDDLRTLSLADAGELKLLPQAVAPRDLLEGVRRSFEPLALEHKVALRVQADTALPDIRVDRERMVQVLANLVSNALRYTPANGTVTLGARQQPGSLQLLVSDTGSGIPADKLPNIFERFYRIEASRTENQGESGLGLAIAKSIVEAHGGTITAESTLGAGTTFIITLKPAASEARQPQMPELTPA